jgi:arylsulfatase A-like enzyme
MVDEERIPPPIRAADPEVEAAQHPILDHFLRSVRRKTCFMDGDELMAALSDEEIRLTRKAYFGLIAEVDAGIGQIVRFLRETGQYDSTLIIFTSDHAEQLGDHFLFSKMGYFDQSYHVPLIIRDPRGDADATRGTRVDEFTESIDLLPTILEWAGLPTPRQCDGASLLPFVRGATPADWRQEAHYEFDLRSGYPDPGKAALGLGFDDGGLAVLRDRQYKYVHCTALPPALYDLARDPEERVNCAADPGYVRIVAEYTQRMLTWRMRHAERTFTHLSATPRGLADRRDLLPASVART